MESKEDSQIDPAEVAKRFNSLPNIWNKTDKWHWYTYERIRRFIQKYSLMHPTNNYRILNAGSGGNSYGINEKYITHVDIATTKINHLPKYLVSNIESINFVDKSFDEVICVGSVINYCDPFKAINELSRVLKRKGVLILEFENSYTFELLGKDNFNRSATFIKSFYNHKVEEIWYYSERMINILLLENGLKINKRERFHIISPLIYRLTKNENISSRFCYTDRLFRSIPFVNKFSSNVILWAVKE